MIGATLSIPVPGYGDIHLAHGLDGRDPATAMPTDGTFVISGATATFAAATVLQLVDEGRLSLDDSVEPWLPELPNAGEITIAMLLGHTSGLGEWTDGPAYEATMLEDLSRSFSPEETLARHLDQSLVGDPGEQFTFSAANYTALGLLVERELGQDLVTVIEDRLTVPLGLTDTVMSDGSVRPTLNGWFSLDGDPDRPPRSSTSHTKR